MFVLQLKNDYIQVISENNIIVTSNIEQASKYERIGTAMKEAVNLNENFELSSELIKVIKL